MGEELRATWLRDRALQFLLEGGDGDAAEWLRACPLLAGKASQSFGDRVQVELEFGCSRHNLGAFQDEEEPIAEQIYSALNGVTRPSPVTYSIRLRYLTPDELQVDRDDVLLELARSTQDEPPF